MAKVKTCNGKTIDITNYRHTMTDTVVCAAIVL